MEIVLKDFKGKHCFVYIDDTVVYARNEAEHLVHLSQVFSSLQEAGLTLNLKKFNLFQHSLVFLGHVVSANGLNTDLRKLSLSGNFPFPNLSKKCRDS